MNHVRLETRDGFLIRIDFGVLQRSKVIQHMCQYSTAENAYKELILPVHGINHDVLLKILLWMEYHKGDEEPAWVQSKDEPADIERHIDDWDKEFLREKLATVRAIMKGADYLDIPWLVKLCARKLRIRGSAELYLRILGTIAPLD
ncbi:E3 ubiquitin ligase complex SCF subunit scon-3 [Drosophila novamexicana]|uniref:E3 ubiquitin ligase complex SCF subunit scon-3 n=1 Tax=Drosophila novamexicana TaxID=47314 RepID=UPI0011E59753|nr:E3 ubiquitin ligase complex SCF subunit scon-3 [Drosophila novamexicana]